jgi:hypothetical protein
MRADQEMPIDIARTHVAESRREELDLETPQHPRGGRAEKFAHSRDLTEAAKVPLEREQMGGRFPLDANSELGFDGHSPTPRLSPDFQRGY